MNCPGFVFFSILDTSKQVLWQTVQILIKCHIRICTNFKDKRKYSGLNASAFRNLIDTSDPLKYEMGYYILFYSHAWEIHQNEKGDSFLEFLKKGSFIIYYELNKFQD